METKPTMTELALAKFNSPLVEKIGATAVQFEDIYKDVGDNQFKSRYPVHNFLRDNEDFYAQQQGFFGTLGNSLLGTGSLALSAIGQHITQLPRFVDAVTSTEFNKTWNSSYVEGFAKKMQSLDVLFPIYETKEQQIRRDQEGTAWTSLKQFIPFTGRAGNAWANLSQQLGFTVGTMTAVGLETAAIGFATAGSGGATAPALGASITKNAFSIGNAMRNLYSVIKTGRTLANAQKAYSSMNIAQKALVSNYMMAGRMVYASSGEAALEGKSASLEFEENQIRQYRELYGTEPDAAFMQSIKENSLKVGNTTALWNMPVLLAGNAITIGRLFKPKNFGLTPVVSREISSRIAQETGLFSVKTIFGGTLKNYPKIHKAVTYGSKTTGFLKENIGEGLEEILQGAGSKAAQHRYDLFDNKFGKEKGLFFLEAMEELKESLGTREGWDEFFSGFLTGFAIKGFTGAYSRVTGRDAQEKAFVQQAIGDITSAHSNYITYLTQEVLGEAQNEAIEKGDNYTAKNLQDDIELNLFMNVGRFGVAEEYFESLGDHLKEIADTNPNFEKEFLKDRTIDEVVSSMQSKFNAFDRSVAINRKSLGNPFKDGTKDSRAWDEAIQIATSLEQRHKSSFSRVKNLSDTVREKYAVQEQLLSAMLDPISSPVQIQELEKTNQDRRERLKLELSDSERAATEKDITETQTLITTLTKLKDKFYDKNGELKGREDINTEEAVSDILRSIYGENQDKAPLELRQLLEDINKLTLDAEEYLNLYNLLTNPQYFSKFGEAYVKGYMKKVNQINNRLNKEPEIEEAEITPTTEAITREDFLQDASNIDLATAYLEKLEEKAKDVSVDEEGNINYKGKKYDSVADLVKEMAKEENFDQELNQKTNSGKNIGTALTEVLNSVLEGKLPKEAPATETHTPSETPSTPQPKSKQENNLERFGFTHNSSNVTVAHYYDNVITRIFKNGIDYIAKKLEEVGYPELLSELQGAVNKVGVNNYTLSTINLMTKEQLLGDSSIESINDENIQIVYDGVRFFIITKGNETEAQRIIQEKLGIGIMLKDGKYSLAFRTDADGNQVAIESGFRAGRLGETNDAAVNKLRRGQDVKLRVADSQYNRDLIAQEKDTKKVLDKLEVEVLNEKDEVVGVVRATDFLFEAKREELEAFRTGLLAGQSSPTLGAVVGTTRFLNFSTARNETVEYRNAEETTFTDRDGSEFTKEYFFAKENGEIVNEKGEVVPPTNFDRGSFRTGAVYMKISNKNGKNHTVQLYKESEGDLGSPTFTEEEFTSGAFKTQAETNLNPYTPIISKRAIIDMSPTESNKDGSQRGVKWGEQEVAATTVEEDYLNIPANEAPTAPVGSVEAKKADIERRRQESNKNQLNEIGSNRFLKLNKEGENTELSEVELKLINSLIDKMISQGKSAKEINAELISRGFIQSQATTPAQIETYLQSRIDGKINSKVGESISQEINAKYDAELKTSEEITTQPTSPQAVQAAKTKVSEAVTNTPEGVAEISQKPVVDAIKELAQGIAFAQNLKGKKLVEAVKKELEGIIDAEDIDGIAADLEKLKPKELRNVTVTVNQGAGNVEINLENTELTQESIVAEDGTIIPIEEVVSVTPYTPEAKTPTSEITAQGWQDVANQPQDVIDQWLRDNAQVGDQFTLNDGTIITVEYNDGANVIISQDRNGYKLYIAFNEKGDRKQVDYIDGKLHLDGKELSEGTPEMAEPSETQAEEEATAPTPEENQFVTKWKQLFSMYGQRGDDMLSALVQAYNDSVNRGEPIDNFEALMEAANVPTELKELFRFVTTPVFQAHLWQHITNSETIWDINGNKRWNQFKEEIAPILGNIQAISAENTPPTLYNNYMTNLGKRLKAIFKKTGINIPDLGKPQFLSFTALQDIANKLSEALSAENIQEGYRAIQQAGLNVTADGLMFVARVARKTIGKNPTSTIDYSSVFTDVAMSSMDGQMYVRNEADGFFVRIDSPQTENFSQEIRNIQKLFLSLFGINMPLSYLAEYNILNGGFKNLKARIFAQKAGRMSVTDPAFSQVEIQKEQILSDENMLKYQKALVISESHDAVYLGTDRYIQMMKTPQGNTVYVKEGQPLTAQKVRNIMDTLGISQQAKKKASTFAKQVEKIRGLKNKINDITCK